MNTRTVELPDETATLLAGAALSAAVGEGAVVWLQGCLGAGKTTLTRGWLQALGHTGNVKSPTYTIVEPYRLAAGEVFHFDLYRVSDPEELELIGIRDYFASAFLCLIEWPEQAGDLLPLPDLSITLFPQERGGRKMTMQAHSGRAQHWLDALVLS